MLDENGKPFGPSDGDFHISSDVMVAEARAKWDELKSTGKLSDEDIRKGFVHQKYSFINRTAVREAFPELEKWSTVWEERLGRPIAPSLFPSSGPPDKSQVGTPRTRTPYTLLGRPTSPVGPRRESLTSSREQRQTLTTRPCGQGKKGKWGERVEGQGREGAEEGEGRGTNGAPPGRGKRSNPG
ncbi:hypothetical protein [Streptomyces sp. NPDC102283]|uniref:hypothetical protein n=1 Tax=Streptomyces sp. NPDC102283 TaxID=3366155 RepID=UPI0037FED208